MNGFCSKKKSSVCLFGAALDTSNLGVSALGVSVIRGFASRAPDNLVTLFDYGRGTSISSLVTGAEKTTIVRCGGFHSKRIYLSECLWNIRTSARFGGLWNAGAHAVRSANAILDISGGDSFTDLYGRWRFRAVVLPKLIALEQRKSLVLLPQTYGPFQDSQNRNTAKRIVRSCTMAWARDARSFEMLRCLLDEAYDPERHRVGVDVAFGLPAVVPVEEVVINFLDWFEDKRTPLVGLNVSGLLWNQPDAAAEQYGLKANYRDAVLSFTRRLLSESDARLLLIPHVVAPSGHYESDIEACENIAAVLGREYEDRVAVAPVVYDPCEVKWIVAQCDWFCGTRMHSAIAALSSGVSAAAISYSPKTLGVFETCEQGVHVADPRLLTTEEVAAQLWESWVDREEARRTLHTVLPDVMKQANEQMDMVVSACTINAHSERPPIP